MTGLLSLLFRRHEEHERCIRELILGDVLQIGNSILKFPCGTLGFLM